jgi:hypothetical protein
MDSKYDSEEESEAEKTGLAANQTESVVNTEPLATETELNNNPTLPLIDKQEVNINPMSIPANAPVIPDLAKNQLANDLDSLNEELADLG